MKTLEDRKLNFIERAKLKHGTLYNYNDSNYIDFVSPVLIFCNRCKKEFKQSPRKHLDGRGCAKCNNEDRISKLHNRSDREKFIEKSLEKHGELYSYEKVEYTNSMTKVKIYCKSCKIYFSQSPANHLSGKGCFSCRNQILGDRTRYSFEIFLSKLSDEQILNYSYDEKSFEGRLLSQDKKIRIFCKKCESEFTMSVSTHLQGHGCSNCNRRGGLNEIKLIEEILKSFDLSIIKQFKPSFLKRQSIDIFIPSLNLGIEYQGIQHFKPVDYFGGELSFSQSLERDTRKNRLCKYNSIELLYFTFKKGDVSESYPFQVITKIEDLLTIIKNKIIKNETETRLEGYNDSSK